MKGKTQREEQSSLKVDLQVIDKDRKDKEKRQHRNKEQGKSEKLERVNINPSHYPPSLTNSTMIDWSHLLNLLII